jgi:hypothetical protein
VTKTADSEDSAGWVREGKKTRFHFGVWLRQCPYSLRTFASMCGVDPAHMSKCANYERKISSETYKRGGAPLSEQVFKYVKSATYKDYLASYDWFHNQWYQKDLQTREIKKMLEGVA